MGSVVRFRLRRDISGGWGGTSAAHYTLPIIGAVSRDHRHLTAIASARATLLCQAWHDCMHNNPPWLPENGSVSERTWRVKIYTMKNDPEALKAKFYADFPEWDDRA